MNPNPSALEVAHERWMMPGSAAEKIRHERLVSAVRRLDASAPATPIESPAQFRDWKKWRKLRNQYLRKMRSDRCPTCKGTGEITVSDGYGGVDYDACPRCQHATFDPSIPLDPIPF